MEALTSASSKGQQLAASTDQSLAAIMSKGVMMPAALSKGVMAPLMPPSKGVPRAPMSKGGLTTTHIYHQPLVYDKCC